jgi:hypothetical protein
MTFKAPRQRFLLIDITSGVYFEYPDFIVFDIEQYPVFAKSESVLPFSSCEWFYVPGRDLIDFI